jgi:hypothetical protein
MAAPAIAAGIWAYRAYRAWRAAQALAAANAAPAATAGAIVGGGYLASEAITGAEEDAQATPVPTTDVCTICPPCARTVVISSSASPQAANHIASAQASGHPSVLTYSPAGSGARRYAALRGIPTMPGMDRDEYPPAVFLEGGAGASVRHIPLADNRSAGGQMAAQLAGATPGCKITMTVGP